MTGETGRGAHGLQVFIAQWIASMRTQKRGGRGHWTSNTPKSGHWLLAVLLSLFALAAVAGGKGSGWTVSASWRNLLPGDACPRFTPTGSLESTMIWGPLGFELHQAGVLDLAADSSVELVRQGERGALTIVGPSRTYFWPNGDWSPIGTQTGTKAHSGVKRTRPQLLLPPVVAGERGTRYEYAVTREGETFLLVLEGSMEVRWLDEPHGPVFTLGPGDLFGAGPREIQSRSPQLKRGEEANERFRKAKEELTPPADRSPGARSADERLDKLLTQLESGLTSSNTEDLMRLYVPLSNRSTVARVATWAERIARLVPGTDDAGRALFQAWILSTAIGDQPSTLKLEVAMHRDGSPTWQALLATTATLQIKP